MSEWLGRAGGRGERGVVAAAFFAANLRWNASGGGGTGCCSNGVCHYLAVGRVGGGLQHLFLDTNLRW